MNGLAYLTRTRQFIEIHRVGAIAQRFRVELLCRSNVLRDLVFHPSSEGFIEPDVVPPSGCNQISEPLMRDLVCLGGESRALLVDGGILIDEQYPLAEGDRAGVLHCASREVWHRYQIELRKRKRNSKITFECRYDLRRQRERVSQ